MSPHTKHLLYAKHEAKSCSYISHLTFTPAPRGSDEKPWFQDELKNLIRSCTDTRTGSAAGASTILHLDHSRQDPAVHNTPTHLSCVCSQDP